MTRVALAREAGINEGYVTKIENGSSNPSPGIIKKLAEALDLNVIDIAYIVGDEDEPVQQRASGE